jgi:hypothetical protein
MSREQVLYSVGYASLPCGPWFGYVCLFLPSPVLANHCRWDEFSGFPGVLSIVVTQPLNQIEGLPFHHAVVNDLFRIV